MTEPSQPTVRVSDGALAGRRAGNVLSFLGIPYAAPPFGVRRFLPPQPPLRWDGVRDATCFGPSAPQPGTLPFVGEALPRPAAWGTDCLTLNVLTPELGRAGLPVLVYLHGGGYVVGSGSDRRADGTAFACDGVVFVSLNYRLGVDGFLPLPGVPANLGLRDQLAALRWVRDNIAAFGGDPDNITVFGNSAGAGSLAAYAAAPEAAGLFRRMILQSAPIRLLSDAERAVELTARITAELGGDPLDLPLEEMLRRHRALNEGFRDPTRWGPLSYLLTPYMPVIDGELVPDAGLSGRVPASIDLLVGSNRDEARLFLLPNDVLAAATAEDVRTAQAAYRVAPQRVSAATRRYAECEPGELLSETITDHLFRGPAVDLAQAHAVAGGATFTYEFAWRPSALIGATHTLELPFLFGRLDEEDSRPLVGPEPPHELSRIMRRAWIDFTATGDPGWPRYDAEDRKTMVFDEHSRVERDPREPHRASWESASD
ncbi:carboxylesterase family protein [Nocardia sp. CDC159]|uniref:Carboxylic ester hydrolase n=1 Tax=Nocardia pulmonis TaxID=2951408 RepID=A0A9X2J3G2_9NOCA|nr:MULTISPECIES: carboxylesterase family protein [Nocardia]MCM6779066.1 carboxylesterase family protein [Nocardia pulmonis]MCM6791956.1 carboxylesterase family protein [Nocardia sp. CDC159]